MDLFVSGKVKDQSREPREYEGRQYTAQQLLLFLPDGNGMGETISVSVQGGNMLDYGHGTEIKIRVRGYEERRGIAVVKCRPSDIEIVRRK